MTKIKIHSLTLSKNYIERHKNGIFLSKLVKIIKCFFFIFGQKNTLKVSTKLYFLLKKGDVEHQYFTLRTIKKHENLSIQNVLKISPNWRIGILINFVLV